jgi:hypothetical protein
MVKAMVEPKRFSVLEEADTVEVIGNAEQEIAILGLASRLSLHQDRLDVYPKFKPENRSYNEACQIQADFNLTLAQANEFILGNGYDINEPMAISINPFSWTVNQVLENLDELYVEEGCIYVRQGFQVVSATNPKGGRGLTATETLALNKISQWWQFRRQPIIKFEKKLWSLDTIETLELAGLERTTAPRLSMSADNVDHHSTYHPALNHSLKFSLGVDPEEPTADVMSIFTDLDLSDRVVKYLPKSGSYFTSNEEATRTLKSTKTTMTKFPVWSRPVLHKLVNAEFNAVSRRLAHKLVVRKHAIDPATECQGFFNAYCVQNWREVVSAMANDPIGFDYNAIYEWLIERPDGVAIEEELNQIMSQGIDVFSLNFVKVHVKLESLLKEQPIGHMNEQKQRIIVWQVKGITVMFSAAFKQAKERLKSLLKQNVMYADGKTPEELDRFASSIPVASDGWFVEDDLEQQDKQTDMEDITVEMAMYGYLGVSKSVLEAWLRVHKNWRAKGKFLTFIGDGMRLTGQATTSLGNAIINMLCHRRFVERMGARILMICFLGDDNNIYVEGFPNTDLLNRETASYYNMFSKAKTRKAVGQFCSLLFYESAGGHLRVCPDLVRLKRRFEVTNGVARTNSDNLNMRRWSYGMMLGPSSRIDEVAKAENWPVKPHSWYDASECVPATATFHNVDSEFVLSAVGALETMMCDPKPIDHEYILSATSRK